MVEVWMGVLVRYTMEALEYFGVCGSRQTAFREEWMFVQMGLDLCDIGLILYAKVHER